MAARTRRLNIIAKPSLAWVLGLPPHRPPWRRTNKKAKAGPTEEELALVRILYQIGTQVVSIRSQVKVKVEVKVKVKVKLKVKAPSTVVRSRLIL